MEGEGESVRRRDTEPTGDRIHRVHMNQKVIKNYLAYVVHKNHPRNRNGGIDADSVDFETALKELKLKM